MSNMLEVALLERPPGRRRRALTGYLALSALICSWVAQSEVAQYILHGGFNKPFLVLWINHGAMALLVPWHWRTGTRSKLESEFGMSLRHILALMSLLSILYTLGDYGWYLALPFISVTEATALFNSQAVFAYVFSVVLLGRDCFVQSLVTLFMRFILSLLGVSFQRFLHVVTRDAGCAAGRRASIFVHC